MSAKAGSLTGNAKSVDKRAKREHFPVYIPIVIRSKVSSSSLCLCIYVYTVCVLQRLSAI